MRKLLFILILFIPGISKAATTTDFISYGSTTAFTCTGFNSLTNSVSVGISCTAIGNTGATPAVDAYVTVISSVNATGTVAPYSEYVYVYASPDNTNFEQDDSSSPAGGGAYTISSSTGTNLRFGTSLLFDKNVQVVKSFSVANLYGGILPQYFGLVIINNTGQTLTSSGNVAYYQLINIKNQ